MKIENNFPVFMRVSEDTPTSNCQTREEELLKDAAENNHILFFEHDLYVECCTVEKTEKGFAPGKTFKLSEIYQ